MNFLFDEEKKKGSYEVESLKDSIRRIKNNLDTIYKELEEIERSVSNGSDLFEVRESDRDDYVKNALNRKRPTRFDRNDTSFEADDSSNSYTTTDFAKKIEDYDG